MGDTMDEDTSAATKFWEVLGVEERPADLPEESNKGKVQAKMDGFYADFEKKLYHIVDDTVTEKDFDKSILAEEGDDVIIVDVGPTIFLCVARNQAFKRKQKECLQRSGCSQNKNGR